MNPHDRTLRHPLDNAGGWTLDCELEEIPVPDANGTPIVIARVPRIERRFASPMHTDAGMRARMGDWRREHHAFLGGVLPTARLSEQTSITSEQAALRAAVIRAIEEGFAASLNVDRHGEVYGYLARPTAIADGVDLDALDHDWRAWLVGAGITEDLGDDYTETIEQVDWAMQDLAENDYSDYLHSLGALLHGDNTVHAAIVNGIVVGDEPARTCAFLLRELTGDQRLWESVR